MNPAERSQDLLLYSRAVERYAGVKTRRFGRRASGGCLAAKTSHSGAQLFDPKADGGQLCLRHKCGIRIDLETDGFVIDSPPDGLQEGCADASKRINDQTAVGRVSVDRLGDESRREARDPRDPAVYALRPVLRECRIGKARLVYLAIKRKGGVEGSWAGPAASRRTGCAPPAAQCSLDLHTQWQLHLAVADLLQEPVQR